MAECENEKEEEELALLDCNTMEEEYGVGGGGEEEEVEEAYVGYEGKNPTTGSKKMSSFSSPFYLNNNSSNSASSSDISNLQSSTYNSYQSYHSFDSYQHLASSMLPSLGNINNNNIESKAMPSFLKPRNNSFGKNTKAREVITGDANHHNNITNTSKHPVNTPNTPATTTITTTTTATTKKERPLYQHNRIFSIYAQNISNKIMGYILNFLEMHGKERMLHIDKPITKTKLTDIVQPQYVEYISSKSNDDILQIIEAANYLCIEPLYALGLAYIVLRLKDLPIDRFNKLYQIHHEFTPEEEALFRKQYLIPNKLRQTKDGLGGSKKPLA
jgi:hypothetical protein